MQTVLHIGMPKTGSTALQECLQASRAYLAGCGILYPENPPGCKFNNHRMLLFGFTPFRKLPRHVLRYPEYTRENYQEKYSEFINLLQNQIERTRPECTVLSSETLFRRLRGPARQSLLAALQPEADSTVIAAYLRRPSEYYLSSLQQKLKSSYKIGLLRVPSIFGVLSSYATAFGKHSVKPRIYDRRSLESGDIIRDFCGAYLPEGAVDAARLTPGRHVNETVSAESMDLLRRYRRAFHPDTDNVTAPDGPWLVRVLREADRLAGAQKPRLRPGIADMIDYARIDPLRVRDVYGLVFPDMDYRRFETRGPVRIPWNLLRTPWAGWRLSDLVFIDTAVQREILHNLGKSRWAREDQDRRRWIDGLIRDLSAGPRS